MALPSNPNTHGYLFTDDIRFVQKAVVMHPLKHDQFLIIKRHDADYVRPGSWDLPGGSVLFGEKHDTALAREVFEETGLIVNDLRPVYVKTRMSVDEKMYFLLIAYKGRAQTSEVILSGEHTDYRWTTADDFVELDPNYVCDAERELDLHGSDFLRDIVMAAKSPSRVEDLHDAFANNSVAAILSVIGAQMPRSCSTTWTMN